MSTYPDPSRIDLLVAHHRRVQREAWGNLRDLMHHKSPDYVADALRGYVRLFLGEQDKEPKRKKREDTPWTTD